MHHKDEVAVVRLAVALTKIGFILGIPLSILILVFKFCGGQL